MITVFLFFVFCFCFCFVCLFVCLFVCFFVFVFVCVFFFSTVCIGKQNQMSQNFSFTFICIPCTMLQQRQKYISSHTWVEFKSSCDVNEYKLHCVLLRFFFFLCHHVHTYSMLYSLAFFLLFPRVYCMYFMYVQLNLHLEITILERQVCC